MEHQDRFFLSVEEAIEACKVYERSEKAIFRKQYQNLLNWLGSWSYERREKIEKAFLTFRDAGLLFLVVTKSKTYDEGFESDLTKLDIETANHPDFSEVKLSVQALPLCDKNGYNSFCNSEWTLEYAGLNAK